MSGVGATALVIGGTGPTGPGVVTGLLERGYEVTVLHGGQHEADLPPEVSHLHVDPHFAETLGAGLSRRSFDLVVAQYGRLRVIADLLRGRTERLIAIGAASGSLASAEDRRWGPLGRPALVHEGHEVLEDDPRRHKLAARIAEAERALFAAHDEGGYQATYLAYPIVYGPRQPAPHEWCIVRRIRDGRRRLIVADGGTKVESRLFSDHAVHAVMLAVDQPAASAGRKLVITDDRAFTLRQRIRFVAAHMGVDVELVDLPYPLATPAHPYWRHQRDSRLRCNDHARHLLGYADLCSPAEAMATTIDWLLANPPEPGGEEERRLGDPFDYAREDALLDDWDRLRDHLRVPAPPSPPGHMYRHPRAAGERWRSSHDQGPTEGSGDRSS